MTRTLLACLRIIVAAVWLAACGTARQGEPVAGPRPPLTAEQARGEVAFMRSCNGCHPQGEGGLGGALNNKGLPGTLVKQKVRGRLPGDMPSFSEAEIPDAELEQLTEYMKALRKHTP